MLLKDVVILFIYKYTCIYIQLFNVDLGLSCTDSMHCPDDQAPSNCCLVQNSGENTWKLKTTPGEIVVNQLQTQIY